MKKFIGLIIGLVIIFGVYKFIFSYKTHNIPMVKTEKIVEVEKVTVKPISQIVEFVGIVRSKQKNILYAQSQGIFLALVPPGSLVKKGEVIATIEDRENHNQVGLLEEAARLANSQLNRVKKLFISGFVTKKSVEDQEIQVLEAKRKVVEFKNSLNKKIIAPFDGSVAIFKITTGSTIKSGDEITSIYDLNDLRVEFEVPLRIAKQLDIGASVMINNKIYALSYMQKILDEETHMCSAYVDIPDNNYIIGSTVPLSVTITSRGSAVVIPYHAIFWQDGKSFVYIVQDNKVIRRLVVVGIQNKDKVEIIQGLREGDKLIVKGVKQLHENMKVKIA